MAVKAKERIEIRPDAKILIVQLRRIGDVLLTTPVIRALREKFPQAHIDFLVEKPGAEILQGNPYLSNILVYDKKEQVRWLQRIHRERYDLIFDFLRNPRTSWIVFSSGARYRVAFKKQWRDFAYNVRITPDPVPKYVPAFKLDLLKVLGIENNNVTLDIVVTETACAKARQWLSQEGVTGSDLLIGISPTSRRQARRWSKAGFARTADYLMRKHKAKVVFLWGPGEEEYVDDILRMCKESPLKHPSLTIAELTALIKELNLFIGNDNGPMHVAQAFAIPTVVIFGPTQSVNWSDPQPRNIVIKADVDCLECNKQECDKMYCMEKVSPEKVIEEVHKVLHADTLRERNEL